MHGTGPYIYHESSTDVGKNVECVAVLTVLYRNDGADSSAGSDFLYDLALDISRNLTHWGNIGSNCNTFFLNISHYFGVASHQDNIS